MPLVPFSNEAMFIKIDKQFRVRLSAGTRDELNFTKESKTLYLAYDKERKLIGVADPDIVVLKKIKTFKFDRRLYTNARRFINFHQLPHDKSYKYSYVFEEDNWLLFELNEDDDEEDEIEV